jgi:hypothetical protein
MQLSLAKLILLFLEFPRTPLLKSIRFLNNETTQREYNVAYIELH